MSAVPFEPSAGARVMARSLRDFHQALVLEGFTEDQAMQVVCEVVAMTAMAAEHDHGDGDG